MPVSNPGQLQILRIMRVQSTDNKTQSQILELYGGVTVTASIAHRNIRTPIVGDYWAVPNDGPPYIIAAAQFQVSY